MKKSPATADGQPIEEAEASDLEDSDVEDGEDDSFIQSDEEELSGTLFLCGPLLSLATHLYIFTFITICMEPTAEAML